MDENRIHEVVYTGEVSDVRQAVFYSPKEQHITIQHQIPLHQPHSVSKWHNDPNPIKIRLNKAIPQINPINLPNNRLPIKFLITKPIHKKEISI